jgi:hypothetical protein
MPAGWLSLSRFIDLLCFPLINTSHVAVSRVLRIASLSGPLVD